MLKTMGRIIRWSGERKKRLYKGFVYSFFNTLFTAMPVMAVAFILNLIMADEKGDKALTPEWVIYTAVFLILMVLGRFLMSYCRAVSQESIAYEVTAEERIAIGDILKRVSLGFFEKKNAGEITAAITSDLSYLEMFSMKMIDTVVNGYIGAFVMILCLAFYNIFIALIALAGIGLSALALKALGHCSRRNSTAHERAQESMISATIEYIRGMQVVKAFKQEGVSSRAIKEAFEKSRKINIKIEQNYVVYNCLHLLSLKLASTGIVIASALFAAGGGMDIPTMLMLSVFSFVIFGHVEQVNNATHVLNMIDATMDKVEEIKNAEFIDAGCKNTRLKKYDIAFEQVSFAYDSRNVLDQVSFRIPENTTTAIVGPSGGGKTTILSLLARFYDVKGGRITIGGADIREMTCDSLLSNISMVFQKVYLFHDTIGNNIRFGRPEASMEEIVKAAKKACCHEFIMNLSEGYDTVIGDAGATLSGGEKQRISIARAMLKDAPIILLDEATASVDPENEHEIQAAISALVKGKTIIIIAHRLATIQNADQILVVDQGKIVQRGIHEQLMEEEGVYKRFMNIRSMAEGWSIG